MIPETLFYFWLFVLGSMAIVGIAFSWGEAHVRANCRLLSKICELEDIET